MTVNASVFVAAQFGVEVTPRTPVAASKKLNALSVSFKAKGGEGQPFRPDGMKYPSFVVPDGDEMTTVSFEGKACYNTLTYVFCSLLKTVAGVQQGGTAAYLWTWNPDTDDTDTRKTFTVEKGNSVFASRVAGALFTGTTFTFTRKEISLSGDGFGTAQEEDVAMTGAPTAVAVKPIMPETVTLYLANTQAGLAGASALSDVSQLEWNLTGNAREVWDINASETTYADTVELAPDYGGSIRFERNDQGSDYRELMRDGTRQWLRIKAVGDQIAGIYYYTLQIDMPIEFTAPGEESDADGVYAITLPFVGVHDDTWGKALDLQLTNVLTTL